MPIPFYNKNPLFPTLFIVSVLVLLIDFIWIGFVMNQQYSNMIQIIQGNALHVRLIPTLLSYVTIILSIVFFSVPYIQESSRFTHSLFYGGFLGALMYGMFSFTNYALISDWSLFVVFLDTLWGFLLYSMVSYIVSFIIDHYLRI